MKIGIYYRKLFFFAFIVLVIVGVANIGKLNLKILPQASASIDVPLPNESKMLSEYVLNLNLANDGSAMIDGKKANLVVSKGDIDELRLIVFNQPKNSYQSATINVNLPKKINRLVTDPKIIAVHGASPVEAQLSGEQITYKARDITESSTVTIVAQFPKGYFSLSTEEEVNRTIGKIPGYIWIFGGIIFPPVALILIFYMIFGSRFELRRKQIEGLRNTPPSNISPALASILYFGHVTPRAIMAMLIDLAKRGFIEIYNKGDDFYIYRHQFTKRMARTLTKAEFYLLDKIFLPHQKKVDNVDVEERIARHIFSRKIALVFLDVYNDGAHFGFFKDNPYYIHLKYRMLGILTFFIGLFGYIIFAVFYPDPKMILFLWIALVIFGITIVNLAPSLTGFSPKGEKEREEWVKFRNFLSEPTLIEGYDNYFEKYLPDAIAMGVEAEWAARFAKANFIMPKWYDFYGELAGIENFAKSFLPVLQIISAELTASSDPLVR